MQLGQEELVLIKGKRSKRPRLSLTMATSSSTTAEFSGSTSAGGGGGGGFSGGVVSDSNVSGSSNSSHVLAQSGKDIQEEEDMANCLMLLAKGTQTQNPPPQTAAANKMEGIYQCKTCNKSFHSFQALGGHRASHKKPTKAEEKKILTDNIKQENSSANLDEESTVLSLQIQSRYSASPPNKTIRVHECSICRAEFASGQALGGHMRRHRPMPRVAPPADGEGQEGKRRKNLLSLDLNLPAPEDHDHRESKFPFASKEQVIVFSASPLVDCHIY